MQVKAEMDKTPVTILQELSVKKFSNIPRYTFLYDVECFKCRVECFGLEAEGAGTRKQAAKHDAANNLLKLIGFDKKTNDDALQSKVKKGCITNFVGALQEYCVGNGLGTPVYQEVPNPHPRSSSTFTMKCIVSSFTATASGNNKRSAKHNAAKTLLNQLEGCESMDLVKQNSHSFSSTSSTCKKDVSDNNAAMWTPKNLDTHSDCKSEDNQNLSLAESTQNEPESIFLKKHLLLPIGRQSNDLNSLDSDDESQ